MYEKGKNVMGKSLRLEIEEMWTPLREIQAEDKAIQEANARAGLGTEYARYPQSRRGLSLTSWWCRYTFGGVFLCTVLELENSRTISTPKGPLVVVNVGYGISFPQRYEAVVPPPPLCPPYPTSTPVR